MELGIVKTSWTTVILPPYSSSIILGYLIYRKTFTHSKFIALLNRKFALIISLKLSVFFLFPPYLFQSMDAYYLYISINLPHENIIIFSEYIVALLLQSVQEL